MNVKCSSKIKMLCVFSSSHKSNGTKTPKEVSFSRACHTNSFFFFFVNVSTYVVKQKKNECIYVVRFTINTLSIIFLEVIRFCWTSRDF